MEGAFRQLTQPGNTRERKEMRTEERKRDVEDISGEVVRTRLRKMKKGMAKGPNNIPIEAWIALGQSYTTNFNGDPIG